MIDAAPFLYEMELDDLPMAQLKRMMFDEIHAFRAQKGLDNL